jgi:TonB-dependent receptor
MRFCRATIGKSAVSAMHPSRRHPRENSMRVSNGPVPIHSRKARPNIWLPLLLFALIPLMLAPKRVAARTNAGSPGTGSTGTTTADQNGKGSVTGHVTDSAGGVLQGASIKIEPGDVSTVSDGQGQFTVTNLLAGSYTVTVSYAGFSPHSETVNVSAGQAISVEAVLQLAPSNSQIEVHADLQGEAEQIQVQRTSENIVNVIDSDVITSLPNANIADAVGRLPGVTLERDEGEGKYVQIRGTEPRLTNVTIEGINVPSPEVSVRQIKLDVIPADLVDSVVLNKTLSANQDGDAIGGTVDLKLKNAGDQPTLIVSGIGGITPILGDRYVGQTTATVGQRFGVNKQFGVLIGFSYDYNGRGIDDIEPGIDAGYGTPIYDSLDLREYRYQRTRWGLAGGADYRLSNNSDIYLHYLYSDFKDYGNKWVYTLNDDVCAPGTCGDGPIITPDSPKFTTSQRTPNQSIGSISGGGKHVFSNSWLAWDISVSNGRELQAAGNPGATFKYSGSATCQYEPALTTNPYKPQWDPPCTAPGSPIFDPTQYYMSEFDTSTGPTDEVSLQGSASYGKNYKWGSHDGTLEFGAKIQNAHDYQNAISPVWDPNDTFLMSEFLSGFKNPNYYDGSYSIGPVTSYSKLNNFFNDNPGEFTEDISDTHLGSDPANYNLTERITAGYIMNTMRFGRWSLQTGLRLEATQLDILGFQVLTVPLGQPNAGDWLSTSPVRSNQWYIDPLPSVQVRYQITGDSDIRAVYGRGLSRPNPYDLVPYSTVDQSTNPYTISLGNPNLKAEHANDFDILYEHYLKPYGVIQGGFFYKQLTDPIYYTNALNANSPLCPADQAPCPTSTIVNGSNAHVGGVELAYLQNFNFLPGKFSGLGMAANYTYTYSQAQGIPARTDTPALQRQAPNSFNIGPSYDYSRFSVHAGLTYNSSMIYQYQYSPATDPSNLGIKGPAGDIYLYSHFQLDAQATMRLNHGLTVLVQGENINNEVFGFYTGSRIYVDQREYYKPTISVGFRWTPLSEK